MHKQPLIALATTSALFLASTAAAGVDHILIFDFGAGEEAAFRDLLDGQNHIADGGWDFDLDPDYGLDGFGGPLTSAGAGPVSPGTIDNDNISMFGGANVGGGNDLVAVGPSGGFGNPSNLVAANYFSDWLVISFTSFRLDTTAMEFIAGSILGIDVVEITVTDSAGERFERRVPAPPSGNGIGIAIDQSMSDETIVSIELCDPGGGAQGVMGAGTVYIPGPASSPADLTNFTVVTGTLLDGVLANLESSDESYVHTQSGFGQTFIDLHHMKMRISATTTVQSPATLDLTIESRIGEPAGVAQIGLLNHNTAQFDPVGGYALGNTDTIDTILDIDAMNYVNDPGGTGDIELSIKHIVFVPFIAFRFESWIDLVEIGVR